MKTILYDEISETISKSSLDNHFILKKPFLNYARIQLILGISKIICEVLNSSLNFYGDDCKFLIPNQWENEVKY